MPIHLLSPISSAVFAAIVWLSPWLELLAVVLLVVAGILMHWSKMSKVKNMEAECKSKLVERDVLIQYAKDNEKKAREEQAVLQTAVKDMLGRLSHDVRNPMNSVIGMTTLLEGTSLTPDQQQYIVSIRQSSTNLIETMDKAMKTAGIEVQHETPGTEADKNKTIRPKPGNNGSNKENSLQKLNDQFAKENPLRIIVAEDDPMNQQLAMMVLKRLGYNADLAHNGKELLEIVGDKNYDIVFMDVQMPEMDGLEATRMIRLCLQAQPTIIALTANAMQRDKEACLAAGMDDYISKPMNIEELIGLLEKWSQEVQAKK